MVKFWVWIYSPKLHSAPLICQKTLISQKTASFFFLNIPHFNPGLQLIITFIVDWSVDCFLDSPMSCSVYKCQKTVKNVVLFHTLAITNRWIAAAVLSSPSFFLSSVWCVSSALVRVIALRVNARSCTTAAPLKKKTKTQSEGNR